ncbi:MAG: PepSY domain-containing protein [Ruminococcus sp.]|nr:PepSY domain-containing protein [Ruminococcus sp.]
MKRLSALTLSLLLVFSLAACTNSAVTQTGNQNDPAVADQNTQAETADATEAPTDAVTQATEAVTEKTADTKISEEKAKSIALEHAGFKESEVKFLHVELDYDDGVLRYEVDFRQGNYEYDYDIDSNTGKILSYDKDIDD